VRVETEHRASGSATPGNRGHSAEAETPAGKILVVDDQSNMRTTLAIMLRGAGYEVDVAADGSQGRDQGAAGAYDVVITDLRMGDHDGIEVLRLVKEVQPMTEVIVMTAYGTIESAVEAMRLGAFDYIQKPFAEQQLLVKVAKALESRRLHGQVRLFAQEFKERYHFGNIVGRSQAVRDVLTRVVKIAPTDAIVLITGESGTGKELIARAVHANSRRAHRPFVTVNCAAITETLLESELFGHARGAFTGAVTARKGLFEEADGGTFFFDEIAETTLTFQAKLLRAIQDGEIRRVGENRSAKVDIRVIAATNMDLAQAVEERRFRQDLYYRLNVARFHLPPLRERCEDIPLLVEFFLDKCAR
jgi:two-component system response regulator HydG